MSRNQWIVIAVLALAVVLTFGCFGGYLLTYLVGGLPSETSVPFQPIDTPIPRVTTTAAEGFGAYAGCFGAIATFLAVLVALFNEPLRELVKRAVQRRGEVEVVGISQIEQSYPKRSHLKTRFKIINKGRLSDVLKVYVTETVGRSDFLELPLLWLHGFAEGEQAATIKEIGNKEHAWIDFLTVDSEYLGETGMFLYLDVGAGVGAKNLVLLDKGKTELVLRIDPRYGKSVQYKVTVQWDGTYSQPEVAYAKVGSQASVRQLRSL